MVMHCGAGFVNTDEIYNIPVAPGSDSYSPVAHGVVRDRLVNAIQGRGLSILGEKWALSEEKQHRTGRKADANDPTIYTGPGARAFGLLEVGGVRPDNQAYNFMIGVRNSQDKTLALGLATGAKVFVCDNLAFSGSAIFYRRHTSGFDILSETENALNKALASSRNFFDYFDALKGVNVTDTDFHSLTCDMIRNGLLTGPNPRHMLAAWHDHKAPEDRPDFAKRLSDGVYEERNLWTAHNLWTDLVGHERNVTSPGSGLLDDHNRLNGLILSRFPSLPSVVK
jgi:hypothetical protein